MSESCVSNEMLYDKFCQVEGLIKQFLNGEAMPTLPERKVWTKEECKRFLKITTDPGFYKFCKRWGVVASGHNEYPVHRVKRADERRSRKTVKRKVGDKRLKVGA